MSLLTIGFCPALVAFVLMSKPTLAYFQEEDAEEKQASVYAERFLSILEKNPQRGTALEKVFVHHLQRGTLDSFVQALEKRTQTEPNEGTAWMLLGLFESQRRYDSQAILAFAQAEKLRTEDALPAYYRGQCLLRTGEPSAAVEAFEIAIQRKPTRLVMLELFELIGRTHQRQNRNDLALDSWKRMEAMFPNDLRVLEQIATVQKQEGSYQDALQKVERLIALAKDVYIRTQFRIEATQLQIQLGERDKGLAGLTTILSELKPDGWLYRDVQRRIEEVYLNANDKTGLIQFYEKRLQQSQDDIESIVRLSKFLATSSRVAEANQWMTQAIERAPSRLDLRRSLIDQLISDQQVTAAVEQYRQLSKLDPTNMDILREWGKLVLRDTSSSIEESKKEAGRIWNKMLESRTDEALVHIQIADLLLSAQMPDEAEKLFERAIQLAPDETQYREFFGDFLLAQNRREEAFAVWDAIAKGERRNAQSVMRLAEIYHHAKQHDRSASLATEACDLAPKDPMVFIRTAKMQAKAQRIDDALKSLGIAETLADNDEQRESIIQDRLDALEKYNRLNQEADILQSQLRTAEKSDLTKLSQKQLLVRYLVRLRRWPEAQRAVLDALGLDGKSLPMLLAASDIAEGLGDVPQSIESLRKLAEIDRRRRQEYLQKIARLQVRQGKFDDAIETAKAVVQALPSKVEGYEFMAQICFQANKRDLGIETLRKAFRIDPGSMGLTIALGNALAESQKYSEAIELYWQTLVKATKIDDKLDLTTRLSKLHLINSGSISTPRNAIELLPLIDRLESGKQDPAQRHDFTLCLAQVYQSVADYANAKRVLEELLSDRARDSNILQQLSKVCADAGDLEMAIDYQQQLVAMLPGQETESQLANLFRQNGAWSEANVIVMKLLQSERDPTAVLQNIDSLLQKGEQELVLQTLEPMLRKQPENWELLFRKGLALVGIDEWVQSQSTLEQILKLEIDRSDSGFRSSNSVEKKSRVALGTIASNEQAATNAGLSAAKEFETIERSELLDIATGRAGFSDNASQRGMAARWSPKTYGEVRWACIAWLVFANSKEPKHESSWIAKAMERLGGSASRSDWIDALAIAKFKQDFEGQIHAIASLIESGEPDMNAALLESVHRRQVSGVVSENKTQRPLTSSQLKLLTNAYESVMDAPAKSLVIPRNASATTYQWPAYPNFASSQYSQQHSVMSNQGVLMTMNSQGGFVSFQVPRSPQKEGVLQAVVNELRFAGQADESEAYLRRLVDTSQTEWQLTKLCEFFLRLERFKDIEKPLQRWFEFELQQLIKNGAVNGALAGGSNTGVASSAFAMDTPTDFAYRIIGEHGEDVSPEFLVRCVELAADISDQQFRNRTFQPMTPATLSNRAMTSLSKNQNRGVVPTQFRAATQVQTWQLQSASQVQTWAVNFVSRSLQNLLLSASRSNGLSKVLQERIDRAEGVAKPLAMLHLVLSHSPELQPTVDKKRIVDALREIGNEPEYALIAAAGLMDRGSYEEARLIAENFTTADIQDTLTRELIILFSSAARNENARVEASLKVLEKHKIDNTTAQSIYNVLQQGSAKDLARNSGLLSKTLSRGTAARPQTRIASPTKPKPVLTPQVTRLQEMVQLSNAGKKEEAVKIARKILSQPRVFPTTVLPVAAQMVPFQWLQASRPPQTSSGRPAGDESLRETAFDILRKHLELEKLMEEAQRRLEAAPNSFVLLEQLAELYEHDEANGNKTKAENLLDQALRIRPNANSLRLHYAKLLSGSGKHAEASDQYLELIRRDATLGITTVGESQIDFQKCGRIEELRKAIRDANIYSVRDRNALLGVGSLSLTNGKGFEVGATIVEKLVELDNTLLQNALLNAYYYPNEIVYPRLLRFTRDALIPNENDVAGNPWFGLDKIMAQRISESFFFRRILLRHRKEDVAGELRSSIQAAADRFPGWLAGQVMLAMIAERTDQPDESVKILIAISRNKKLFDQCPETVAYELGKLFVAREETRTAAIKLLEPLCSSRQFLAYEAKERPAMILAKIWLAEGKRTKAVESLILESQMVDVWQRGVGRSAPLGKTSASQMAEQLLILGLPIDGYRLLEIPTNDMSRNRDTQEYSAVANVYKKVRQNVIDVLEKMPAQKAIAELLFDRTNVARQLPVLELMFYVPSLKEVSVQSSSIESVSVYTLVRHAKAGQMPAIEEGLQKLTTANPTDLTVLATQAIVRLEMGSSNVIEPLDELERLLSKFDPEINDLLAIADRSDSDLRVPGTLRSIAATWLVARQCYASGKHLDLAERIGTRAVKAARVLDELAIRSRPTPAKNNPVVELGPEAELARIILFEWGRTEIREGRIEQGSLKWRELAERVCSMNDGKPSPVPAAGDNVYVKGSEELFWQREPFEWMMLLANSALDSQQLELSKDIVREVTKRRLPVNVPFVTGKRKGSELEVKSAAQMLHRLLARWPQDKETASERFAALLPVFLPGDNDMYLFFQNTNLLEEKPISLATSLIESATQSDRLMELRDILDQREPKGASYLSWLILRVQVAIAAKDIAGATEFLARLKEHIRDEKQLTTVAHACHAAIPAFQLTELREAALPILNDYLAASKRTGNYPEVDFSLFPLVREVNDYLMNK